MGRNIVPNNIGAHEFSSKIMLLILNFNDKIDK